MQASAAASRPGSLPLVTHHPQVQLKTHAQTAGRGTLVLGRPQQGLAFCPYHLGVEINSENDVASEAEYDSIDESFQ